jgi:hypothetical protein
MTSARERRQQAHSCAELAKNATDEFTKGALVALAQEFQEEADALEHSDAAAPRAISLEHSRHL